MAPAFAQSPGLPAIPSRTPTTAYYPSLFGTPFVQQAPEQAAPSSPTALRRTVSDFDVYAAARRPSTSALTPLQRSASDSKVFAASRRPSTPLQPRLATDSSPSMNQPKTPLQPRLATDFSPPMNLSSAFSSLSPSSNTVYEPQSATLESDVVLYLKGFVFDCAMYVQAAWRFPSWPTELPNNKTRMKSIGAAVDKARLSLNDKLRLSYTRCPGICFCYC
jgi:hypothetical protein